MGDYFKDKGRQCPEPGRQRVVVERVEKVIQEPPPIPSIPQPDVDVNAIAQAVAQALGGNIVMQGGDTTIEVHDDSFSSKDTLKALAQNMLVERGKQRSNFEGLGNVKETEKDSKGVSDAIDFLSNLDD